MKQSTDLYMKLHTELGRLCINNTLPLATDLYTKLHTELGRLWCNIVRHIFEISDDHPLTATLEPRARDI